MNKYIIAILAALFAGILGATPWLPEIIGLPVAILIGLILVSSISS